MDTKKKKVLKITGIVAIVAVLLSVIGISVFKQTQKVALQSNPEIRRSMEYEQVTDEDKNTNSPYVQFNAFFLRDLDGDGYAESIRGTCRDISETDTLYMNINVLTNGTFKNGKITINGQNMNLQTAIVEDDVVKQNYISDNTTTIELKDMANGTQKLMYGTVKASDFGNDTTKYSKVNTITLTGTHVADDGTQTQVSKTVDFTVDWHGRVQTSIYNYTGTQDIESITDGKNVTLSFSVKTRENVQELILKDAVLEGTIPEINGYKPISVETTSNNVDFNYDSETGNFTFKKEATLGENGIVTNSVSNYNTFSLKVTYPYEVYESLNEDTLSIQVPVKAYYEGYNNPNSEFENPIKSNIAERTITFLWRKPEGSVAIFDATIGTYRSYDRKYVMSKEEPLKLYNGTAEETEDLYTVRWEAYTGNTQVVNSIQMKETQAPYTDRFLNSSNTYFNMSDYTNNIGIYFTGAENTLGADGYIKVINDETGEEIHTFTKDDWGNYSSSNPYKYETPVKHIRIETSKANANSRFYVYNIKEIDDNALLENFSREEFDKLQYVYTYLTGNIMIDGSSSYTSVNDDIANAIYEAPLSEATLGVNRDTIGTQTKEDDINLTIDTKTTYYNTKGWTNGKFIIELPEQILDVEINDVTISNSSVKILGYEIFEKNGQKFIRVETENTDEASYSITVNVNLTADPRAVTQTTTVKLYGYNEACQNYRTTTQDIYDIDGDENLTENINYATDGLFIVSPSSLLTNQQATDYNEAGETAIAPQIATIDKLEADTAKVNLSITNNYEGTISEMSILGKIPFEGNTFSINGADLGSNFTTEMLSEGITVPDDMKDKVTVYYSENGNPTNDLNNVENGWKTKEEVTNWSAIKTYLIDLGDYVLNVDETREFSYKIKVPSTVQYNDVSYSTHAVYFCLDTEQGKYRTQTETTKLGFRIERKYNFNIQKLKENAEVPVQGATFSITADGEEESRIGTTNNSGNISIENLYVDKTYTLKEIRTPGSYESLGGDIRFKVSVVDDKLVLNILEGEGLLKDSNVVQATGDSRGTINFTIENTPKYKLEITKKDQETGVGLKGIKYKLEGEGLGTGIIATTNKEGKLVLTGLSQEVEYTLTETEADGYYVNKTPVTFKVENNGGNLSFVVTSGNFTSNSQVTIGTGVTGLDAQDTVTAELTDEKIPTYSLQLKKLAKDGDMTLKGAQYMITGEGFDENGETFITDDQGVLTIPDLYEYVEGKDVTGVYTLKEITPPEGYTLDSRELQFRAKRNAEGNLELEVIGENFLKTSSITGAESETPVINIELEDEPLFKLTKVDGTTRNPVSNAKFVIYEIDKNYNELGYAKDINGNEVGSLESITGNAIFSLDEETNPWIKLQDGTYQSDIAGKSNGTATMTSKEFTLDKSGSISFDWAVSSQGASYDYLYYTITNTVTNKTIGGTSTKIGGNSSIKDYSNLSFTKVTEDLDAGTYKIEFTYRKNASTNSGLDAGFVKNVKIEGVQIPVIVTDENGEISYGLKSGLYKAVEIEAPEGYELPENEADRTYYFGIDASKAQETGLGTSVMHQVSGANWEKVEAVDNTTDNGYVVSGYFCNNADFDKDGVYDIKGNENAWSGFVAKYDKDGNFEFAKSVYTLDGEVKLHKVIQTSDGGYVAVGYYTGSNLTIGDTTTSLEGKTYKKALIVKFGSSGEYQWSAEQERVDVDAEATAVGMNLQGNVLVGVTYNSGNAKIVEYAVGGGKQAEAEIPAEVKVTGIAGENNQEAVIVSEGIADTTTGRIDAYQNGSLENKMTLDFNARDVARLQNGKYVVVGNYTGTAQSIASKGNYDGIVAIYDINSNIIESNKFVRGTLDDIVTSVKNAADGGYIVGGYIYSGSVDLNNDGTNDITRISGNSAGLVIKYSEDGTQEWVKQVSGDNYNQVTDVTERAENEFVAVGYFNSSKVKGDVSDSDGLSLTGYSDGFIFNYGEVITAPEVPETSEITVANSLKQYKITTDVEEVNGVKGGSISGEDEQPYETVEHGKDSTKEIKIIPDTGYKVLKITINGQEYNFTPAEDGTVTMPQFTNMTTDKHVVVTFSNTVSNVIVHHYIDGTETPVAPDETISGNIGDNYTTAPKMDLEEYELKKDENGDYVVPDNASGTYTEDEQVVTYYYVKKQVSITVEHLIEGTDERVPLVSGEPAQDETLTGEIGTNYQTEPLTPEELNAKYELSIIPENQNGVYSNEKTVVIYYYKAKNVEITTDVKTHKETNEMGEEIDVKGGSISGEDEAPYETVVYGEDSQKDIIITPDEGYQIKEILVNDKQVQYTPEEDGTATLDKFIDMTENKHVVVEFEKIPATVIVHHYIENTTDKVPNNSGGVVEDELKQGVVGDIYATQAAKDVAPNYELVAIPENASGEMTKDTIIVTYYYRLKDPTIEKSEITKESNVEKVTDVNQTIDYTVNYKASINDYIGDATVTIVDELPYEIDTTKAYDLAGGVYDSESKTITWTEKIENIDTFTNVAYSVDITKEISLVYKDIDITKNSISNKVTGKVELETPEKEDEVEDTKEIPAEYLVNIHVTKKWVGGQIVRPYRLTIIVKNGNQEVTRKVIDNYSILDDVWETEITNLPKYDEEGQEINYTVEEEYESAFEFDSEISGNMKEGFVITNTFTSPMANVYVKKEWEDTYEQQNKRPDQIVVSIEPIEPTEYGSYKFAILNEENNWEEYVPVQQCNPDGSIIEYRVKEVQGENEFYTNSDIIGDMNSGFVITNTFTRPTDTTQVTVNKVWNDNNDEAKKRPSSVILTVSGNGQKYSQEVNGSGDTWSYTFTNLPKYDENGDIIEYTVDEEKLVENSEFYLKSVNQETDTVTNTFKVPGDNVTIKATKVWDDNENIAGKRPESITLQVKDGERIVASEIANSGNNWQVEFTVPKYDNLGNEIEYTVSEEETGSIFYTVENSEVSGDMDSGFTVTNKFEVPDDTIEIPVTKVWDDSNNLAGKRPTSITVKLTGSNGTETTQEVTGIMDTNEWTYTFRNLPKYDDLGNLVTYTLNEIETGSIFYTKENSEVSGDMNTGFTVTNKFEVPGDTVEVPVSKEWLDANNLANKRPEKITLKLTGSDGTEKTQELTGTMDSDNWTYTFTGLNKYDSLGNEINYTVTEEPTGSIFYTEENTNVSGNMTSGYTITNMFEVPEEKVSVDVSKVWVDTAAQQDKRPSSVTVQLKSNGELVTGKTLELNSTNEWKGTFADLDKYDNLGNSINYTVEEVTTNKFYSSSSISGNMTEGYTITNTFERPEDTTQVTVNKVWADNNDEAKKRPSNVTLIVTGNGQTYKQIVTQEEGWSHTFANLPKYDENGNEIEYIVDEEALTENAEFYQKTLDQKTHTVTNTFTVPGEEVIVKITKAWDDNENVAGKRPESVTLQVKNGEIVIASEVVDADDNWTHDFSVKKYDNLGNEINYTADEEELGSIFYTKENSSISGDMNSGFTVTNRFVVPDEKVNVDVSKVWEDTEAQQDKRPSSVIVQLKANGEIVEGKTVELNSANEWKGTFENLAKYDNLGNNINYTVEEQETNVGDLKFYTDSISGDMEAGYIITNTFTRPTDTINIIANKVWNDNEEQSSRRPESITFVIKNGDEEVARKVVTKQDNLVPGTTNKWSVEFTGLPKYDENGNEIKYTLEEQETNSGDLHFYKAEENNVEVKDNQANIRNNFVKPEDTTKVTATKVWNDNNDVNNRRPSSVKLQVKNGESVVDEQIVTKDDNWTYTFNNLPKYDDNGKEIVYTVSETEVNTGDLKFYVNDGITGDMTNGYKVTNTFKVPDEDIELKVNKVWVDNDVQSIRRPDVVIINVLGEDKNVVASHELNVAAGEETYTFTGLDKYNSNGQEIEYTVEEKEKNEGDLHFYTEVVGNVENTGENSKEVTITNTFEKPNDTTDVTLTKVWEDNNNVAGKRPSSIMILLKKGTEIIEAQKIDSLNAVDGNSNNWSYTFNDLPKYDEDGQEIKYTADEKEVNSGDLQFYNKSIDGAVITNTFTQDTTKVSVPITKVWEDNETQSARRPESVIVILKANDEEVQRYELTQKDKVDENTWKYTFEGLQKYDEYNNIINYTIEETEKNSGDLKFYTSSVEGTTITNTFTKPNDTISLKVDKEWKDQEDSYSKRPVSIRVNVKNGTSIVQTAIITKEDNWTHTFEKLPKYDNNGSEIEYTVEEEPVMENDLYYYTEEVGDITNVSENEKEITITNNMTKIPGTVVIKYKDKNTGEEISEEKTKEGPVGDPFDVTEDVKEIPGYTLVEEPAEKTGEFTPETQEKIYYYAKNTSVLVKYLEQDDTPQDDADNKVLADEILISGYEGEGYTTNSKQIDGYTLVATKGNLNGTMTKEQQVVVYYYAKNTKVIVKYLEKDETPENPNDNKVLSPEKTIEGYVGEEYTTTEETIPGYTLVEKTTNFEGVMTEEVIEVIYYYAKDTSVIVKYLEQGTNKKLADEIVIDGYVGKDYETEKKDIDNYTFVEDTKNTTGKMTEEVIEVIYYYAQNTKAKVEHIDRETGEILKEETTNGKVGDLFETHPEDFEGYVLVEAPEEPDIIMDNTGEQVVKYYYAHVSAGVIEKHIDIITGELLVSEEHKGNEGDSYNIPSREFDGYDLVETDEDGNNMLPNNSSGTMKRDEVIEVRYYYIKKATVVVKYVDENTGEEIAKEERIEGHENDPYKTEAKEIEDYKLSKVPDNATGTMTITKNEDGTYDTEIEVIYYYNKTAGRVIENHIDVDTNEKLAQEIHEGNVGDEYDIPSRTFDGYDLVTDMLPNNASGTMTEEEIVVNYYYKKRASVRVEYIDKDTGEKITEDETINGHVGDEYSTEEKQFDGYDLIEKPSNDNGEMTEDEIIVKYYYARKAEVEVKYLEKGTDYEVAPSDTILGHVGDKYETKEKDVPYYKFVEKTENWKGNMTKDKITVIYYYEKQIFNLGVDKWVGSVSINGISTPAQSITSSNEVYKVDVHRTKAETADIKVTYKIRITNKGEIEGTVGKLTDIIPAGYSFYQEDNSISWENNNGVLTTEDLKDDVIKAGEYKEIEVTLRWNTSADNFGQKDNMVILTQLDNPAGYEDIDKEDNNDTSSMILTVATGLDRNDRIVIIAIVQIVLVITVGLLISYKKKEKNEQ